jgi:DNA-binding beta-propeller fold protein YncE
VSAVPSMTNCRRAGWFSVVILIGYLVSTINTYAGQTLSTTPLAIPKGSEGIGFDDLGFSPELHKVLIPAGRTGKLILIEPGSNKMEEIDGFSSQTGFGGDHGQGVTSADTGRGAIFTTDRSEKTLDMVDPVSKKILSKTRLASGPDYVRYVSVTNEVWVTEPHASQIEIFSLPEDGSPRPNQAATIKILNGPESLVIDAARGRAYTNLWTDTMLAIDLRKRAIVAQWKNGCRGSRGIALDSVGGFALIGCDEGKLESLSVKDGHRLGEASSGDGVDIIAYSSKLHHAYLPGGQSATMAIIKISPMGQPTVLTTVTTAKHSHCVTTDDLNNAYICDPQKGRLLIFHDSVADSSQ